MRPSEGSQPMAGWSEVRRAEPQHSIEHTNDIWSGSYRLEGHRHSVCYRRVDPPCNLGGKAGVKNLKINFEIQPQGSRVKVGRSHVSPQSVDRKQLRVIERAC